MSVAHKNAEIICAWVNGARIQYQSPTTDEWCDVPAAVDMEDEYLKPNPIHPDYAWFPNWRVVKQE